MSKIIALYINEISKMIRKASTIVILSIIIAACIAIPIFLKLATPLFTEFSWSNDTNLQAAKDRMDSSLLTIEKDLSALDQSEESEMIRYELLQNKKDMLIQLERVDLLIAAGYTNDESADFIYDAGNMIYQFRATIRNIESMPASERTQWEEEHLAFCRDAITFIQALPQTHDFRGYIDLLKSNLASIEKMPNGKQLVTYFEKEINSLEMIYQADPSGGTDGTYNYPAAQNAAMLTDTWEDELDKGYTVSYSFTGEEKADPLTPEKQEFLENSIVVLEHRIITDSYPQGLNMTLASMGKDASVSVGKFLAAVLIIMAAGSSIAQEIATGSIKSLIIAPVRRWKIFTAKLMALLSILIASLLMISILSSLTVMTVFGGDAVVDYVYANNGVVGSVPYILHDILFVFVGSVDILVFMIFALMLSTLIRNTASAVGLSVAIYLITGSVSQIFMQLPFPRQLWMDFIPFLNFDLASDVFPFVLYTLPSDYSELALMNMNASRPGLLFSSVYLIILVFCMLLTSYDSFSRRDIK